MPTSSTGASSSPASCGCSSGRTFPTRTSISRGPAASHAGWSVRAGTHRTLALSLSKDPSPHGKMDLVIFDRIAELKIREAIAEGKFDHLPNAGQPLDLDEYFQTPAEWRLAYSILKSAKCLPEEVEVLN